MNDSFMRFGSVSAIISGVLSIIYAIFLLGISSASPYIGYLGSWVILALSGFFFTAAYLSLYKVLQKREDGFSLYAMLLGVMASFITILRGGYQSVIMIQTGNIALPITPPSQTDPGGIATFGIVGLVSLIFGWLILRTSLLPKNLGYIGILNAVLLVILYFSIVFNWMTVTVISGGLSSVIVSPLWWIWLGLRLQNQTLSMQSDAVKK